MLALLVVLAAQMVALPALSRDGPADASAALCIKAAKEASRETGVPFDVLVALTLTETGRTRNGQLEPWPWALNEGGKSNWFADRDQALTYLSDAVAAGTSNIDVGCFQLNYRWHGAAFADLQAMMDPKANAIYAARLMRRLAGDSEDWLLAAGAYHSSTPDVAARYLARFDPIYAALGGGQVTLAEAAQPVRANAFPLLQPGGARSAGSIVPIAGSGRRLIGGP
jgi:hypothetical protein